MWTSCGELFKRTCHPVFQQNSSSARPRLSLQRIQELMLGNSRVHSVTVKRRDCCESACQFAARWHLTLMSPCTCLFSLPRLMKMFRRSTEVFTQHHLSQIPPANTQTNCVPLFWARKCFPQWNQLKPKLHIQTEHLQLLLEVNRRRKIHCWSIITCFYSKWSFPCPDHRTVWKHSSPRVLCYYTLLKLAFWQACMKWVRISARTAPLVLITVVLLVWQSTICRGPGPTGVKLNPDACYLATPALSHPILHTGFHKKTKKKTWPTPLRAAEQSFMYGSRLLGRSLLK